MKTYRSGVVYKEKPTEAMLKEFGEKCCNGEGILRMYDLDPKTIETTITELEIK